jgi:hypothetical protein
MDIVETILRWIAHAAIFRAMWSLGLPGALIAGAVALVGWWLWRRRRRN